MSIHPFRPPLNGLDARTARDTERSAYDWADPKVVSHVLGAGGAMRRRRLHSQESATMSDDEIATLAQAHADSLEPEPRKSRMREFVAIYRLYRRSGHARWYCLRRAYIIAIKASAANCVAPD